MQVTGVNQEQQYKKPSTGAIIGGVAVGSVVNNYIQQIPPRFANDKIIRTVKSLGGSLSADEFSQIENAITKIIETSGLSEKGVKIIKATVSNQEEISKIFSQEMNKGLGKFLPEKSKEFIKNIHFFNIFLGNNAGYAISSKKVIIPEKQNLAVFHEIGHAMNDNLSHIGKALQKCRRLPCLAIPIALIALWKTKKAPGEKPEGKIDKATTFIKENAGKLTFATFLPVLLEEGMATLKGYKVAKKLLNPDLAKKVIKTNAIAYLSYLSYAVLSTLGIYLGVKVKDAIAKPKPIENKSTSI